MAAPSFHGTIVSFEVEAFIPIAMAETLGRIASKPGQTAFSDRQLPFVIVSGHLRPGTTLADASAEVAVLSAQLDATAPPDAQPQTLAVVPFWNSPFGAQTYMLPSIAVLSAMGGLLLLIVCANLSGLVLARALSRSGEVALRLALG